MYFSTMIWKNVTRRPLRSALTVLAIAAGVGTVVAFVGIATSFEQSFLDLYRTAKFDIIVTRTGAAAGLASTLPEPLGAKIEKIQGVTDVFPGLAEGAAIEETGNRLVVLQGWPPGTKVFDGLQINAGRTLEKNDVKAVMIGVDMAAGLGKKVGDEFKIFDNEVFKIVGIFTGSGGWENMSSVIMPLKELQRLMGRPNQVNGFSVRVDNPDDPELVRRACAQIAALGNGIQAKTPAEHVQSLRELQLAKAMSWLVSSIALVIGGFGMMNTMVMSVQERTREIGILRAIGWSRRRVVQMILLESVILSMIGAVVGSAGAAALLRFTNEVPAVKGLLSSEVRPLLVVQAFGIAAVIGVLCAALPARRAARMLPTTALRHE